MLVYTSLSAGSSSSSAPFGSAPNASSSRDMLRAVVFFFFTSVTLVTKNPHPLAANAHSKTHTHKRAVLMGVWNLPSRQTECERNVKPKHLCEGLSASLHGAPRLPSRREGRGREGRAGLATATAAAAAAAAVCNHCSERIVTAQPIGQVRRLKHVLHHGR